MEKQVIVGLHDVCPAYEADFMAWRRLLDEWGVVKRSLAVIPCFEGSRLRDFPVLADALRAEIDAGSEILLHGFQHCFAGRHEKLHRVVWSGFFTRGCEEFAALGADEAEKLMNSGLAELASVLPGVRVDGFVAPGWWHSRGTLEAASRVGLRFAQGLNKVFDLRTGKWVRTATLCGLPMEAGLVCMLVEKWGLAQIALLRGRVACLALHPYDLRNPRFLKHLEKTLRSFQDRSAAFKVLREFFA